MKTYPTDEEFWDALQALSLRSAGGEIVARDPEACAALLVEFAEATDDQDAWKLIAAVLAEFIAASQPPPAALLKGLSDALQRWRAGESIAVVFGEKRGKGLRGARLNGLVKRTWGKTNAGLMRYFLHSGGVSMDAAARAVAELRGRCHPDDKSESVSTIKRQSEHFSKK